jgi:GT2 family glycosyltransferase
MLQCIQNQSYHPIKTAIFDDGSIDGTRTYIQTKYSSVGVILGKGNSWWTGGLFSCVENVFNQAKEGDYVLSMNNDCTFNSSYIQNLVRLSEEHERAIIGSLAVDQRDRKKIVGSGVRIDWEKARIFPFGPKNIHKIPKKKIVDDTIDTLSTRGTLYPIEVFKKIGNFDKKNFPQYLSDYEFACRAKSKGYKLLISYRAKVYTDSINTGIHAGNTTILTPKKLYEIFFSKRSKNNIIDRIRFIHICCPKQYRLFNYWKYFEMYRILLSQMHI